ncbi:MAG TPA: hemerythrin domain-containing protein [Nannocystaceae bacterium]|nr:hemerythrin domain-containing protein [Nannocystaceae bacterium]
MEDAQHRPLGALADAYVELIQRFDALCGHARAQEWSVLAHEWPHFVASVDDRCRLEEEVLLPAYAEQGPAARALVKQLVEEHAALRQLITETSRQIRRRHMRPVTQELLLDLLREHAALESQNLDPWIALDVRDWSLQLRRVPTLP